MRAGEGKKRMKKGFKRKLAAWVGILFVITQIIPARTINATTEEEENKKYGTIEHYNGILFGDDKLVSYDNKSYAYISKGGDNEGAVAVGGDMYTPYLDNSMDFGASAASGYTGIGSKYEDNGMPTVMTSGKWDKIIGSNITVYGSRVLLAQEYNQGFTVMGSDVNYSGEQNIKNSISKFKGKVSNTIGYIEGLETNGSFEDNSYGKNIITNNEKNIVKVKLDSGMTPSLDLKGSVDLDKQYVIYSDAKDIKFSGGCVRYDGADVWGSSLPKDSPLFKIASNFIWVFPNAETVEINNYAVIGSVVAPKAKVHGNGSSINGQLFASSLHQEGGFELHNFTSRWNWDLDLKGSISIEKVDSEDSSIKLSGAVFEVKDSEGAVVDTITTDENGVGTSKKLPYGNYTLEEVRAPSGYELSEASKNVTIDSNGQTIGVTFENTKILGKISILKVDSADKNVKLPGAVFEVKDSKGTVVDTITTGENGVGTSKELPYGNYTVEEVGAPSGYELLEESENVTISSNGETIKLTFENSKLLGLISIEKVDSGDSEIKLEGAEFKVINSNGEEVGNIVTGEDGKGSLGNLPYGEYTLIETKAPDGYEISSDLIVVEVNSETEVYKTITNTKILGKINILKVDSADRNVKLQGAVFEVKDSEGDVVDTITTGENGVGTSKELPYGSYTVQEVSAPSGYELSEESRNVIISLKGQTIELTFENTKLLGKISILKVDSADENVKLQGAVFEVKDSEGTVVDTISTDENGVGTSKELPYGNYTVVEVNAPSGYKLSQEVKNVTIDSNGETIELTFKNSKFLGSISIEKVDSEDSEIRLEGAEFEVINSNGEEVGNIVTGEDGKGSLGNLPYGEYTLIETKAPDGYELSLDLIVVEVNSETEVYKTITNTKILGKINILKVDSIDENVKLQGAVFEVKDSEGDVVDTITTGENGVGTSKELPYGSYTVQEVSAPSGYELSEESRNVIISLNGQTIELTFENTKLLGKISILKVDSDDENVKLQGAVFEVKDSEGTVVDIITTGENGVGTSKDLPYGNYTVEEVIAPSGYKLSEESKNVTISLNGKTIELTFENSKLHGSILIEKVDSADENVKLHGAVFEVKDSEGTVVDTITTEENGVGASKELLYGSYTVTEVTAPTGYELSEESKNVTISSNVQTIELTFKNSKLLGSISIEKVDINNEDIKLKEAEFKVLNSHGQEVGNIVTGEDGKGSLGNLPYGKYTLIETKAPDGYQLCLDLIVVEVNSKTEVYKTITNTKVLGKINILKVDSADEKIKLQGAIFEVKDSEGNVVDTITTGENGVGTSKELPYGNYKVEEVGAPSGYELSDEFKNVTIDSNGQTIELTFKNSKLLGLISIEKIDSEDSEIKLEGAEFKVINSNGEEVGNIITGEDGKGILENLPYGEYTLIETKAPDGYELSLDLIVVEVNSGTGVYKTITNTKILGKINILKIDSIDENVKLQGAVFEVKDSEGTVVDTITTGENGVGTSKELPYGSYTVQEVSAPSGYKLLEEVENVTISLNGQTIELTFENTKILGKISILKVDSDDENVKLPGAVFEVRDSEGTVVDTITTGENGVGTSKELPYGNYTVAELNAPSGYKLSQEVKNVTIDSNGQTIELTFKNSKLLGLISIEKVDSEDSGIKLEGAEFKVINFNGEEVGNIVTGEDGKGSLGNLPYGEYTLIETKAPDGYELSLDLIVVEVNSETEVYKTITNTKILGNINILKVDSADENVKLQGAVFEVKDSEGDVVDTITTDENGVGASKELPYGSYTVQEVSAPSGYKLLEEVENVTISLNGQTIELTFENTKILGKISILKVDSDDENVKLQGAVFEVKDSEGTVVDTITTGENGVGTSKELPYGSYTVAEISSPTGYELSEESKNVIISSNGEIIELTFENTKILGKINILKVDSDDESIKLSGAVFEVKNSEGVVVDTITTDENGVGASKELLYGSYTVTEVTAPTGYELSEESKNVTISSNGETLELTFENIKILGKINILKVDSIDESIKLSGAEFEIRDLEGNILDTLITNEEGVANSIQLPYGSYIVIETKAPEGYVLNDFSENVTINNENIEILLKVENIKEELLPEDPKEPEVPSKEDNKKEPVKTGDESGNMGGLSLISLLSLIAMLLMHKKK